MDRLGDIVFIDGSIDHLDVLFKCGRFSRDVSIENADNIVSTCHNRNGGKSHLAMVVTFNVAIHVSGIRVRVRINVHVLRVIVNLRIKSKNFSSKAMGSQKGLVKRLRSNNDDLCSVKKDIGEVMIEIFHCGKALYTCV